LSLSKNKPHEDISVKRSTDEEPTENQLGVTSVKEHAKKLNRLNTQTELRYLNEQQTRSRIKEERSSTLNKTIELEYFDLADLKPIEKQWILACSRCDYMEINRFLSKDPYLAQRKDPFTVILLQI
jgi:hypothetical protein